MAQILVPLLGLDVEQVHTGAVRVVDRGVVAEEQTGRKTRNQTYAFGLFVDLFRFLEDLEYLRGRIATVCSRSGQSGQFESAADLLLDERTLLLGARVLPDRRLSQGERLLQL